jgi:hypothetical protein
MDTTALDTLTDQLAKSNPTMFPIAEKLTYYNIGYGILYGMILDEKEDNYEEEDTSDTIADQSDYGAPSRIHHINWLKINYGDGLIPARYKSEQSLISKYGSDLETTLSQWSQSNPIYYYKGDHFFVYPAPTLAQAGADRLKASFELLPADLVADATPDLPENFHYLLGVYAAKTWLDEDDPLWVKREKEWNDGSSTMIKTMFPRNRQEEMQAQTPDDDGSNY